MYFPFYENDNVPVYFQKREKSNAVFKIKLMNLMMNLIIKQWKLFSKLNRVLLLNAVHVYY